jgi:sirohydrochlorin ferrochelatase
MTAPDLLLLAHGSSDAAATASVLAVRDRLASLRPGVTCAAGFLEKAQPSATEVLATLRKPVVVVPLLLAAAFHARVDIEGLVTDGVVAADVLGDDAGLVPIAADRLGDLAGSVVLATAGTSDPTANATTVHFAERLAGIVHRPVTAAFASAAEPTVAEAISSSPSPVVVLRWLLSPGTFADRIAADARAAGAACTDVIGDHPALAELLLARYDAAVSAPRSA